MDIVYDRSYAITVIKFTQTGTGFLLHLHFKKNKFKSVGTAVKQNRIIFLSNFTASCFRVSVLLNVPNIKAYCREHFIFIRLRNEISYLVKKHSVLKFWLSAFKTARDVHNFSVTLQHLRLIFTVFRQYISCISMS